MEYELKGALKTILPVQSGTSKAGKEWKKVNFIVANNDGYEGKEQEFAPVTVEEPLDDSLPF